MGWVDFCKLGREKKHQEHTISTEQLTAVRMYLGATYVYLARFGSMLRVLGSAPQMPTKALLRQWLKGRAIYDRGSNG